jgi:hypothetical protein
MTDRKESGSVRASRNSEDLHNEINMARVSMRKESVRKESIRKESIRKESIRKESIRNGSVREESIPLDYAASLNTNASPGTMEIVDYNDQMSRKGSGDHSPRTNADSNSNSSSNSSLRNSSPRQVRRDSIKRRISYDLNANTPSRSLSARKRTLSSSHRIEGELEDDVLSIILSPNQLDNNDDATNNVTQSKSNSNDNTRDPVLQSGNPNPDPNSHHNPDPVIKEGDDSPLPTASDDNNASNKSNNNRTSATTATTTANPSTTTTPNSTALVNVKKEEESKSAEGKEIEIGTMEEKEREGGEEREREEELINKKEMDLKIEKEKEELKVFEELERRLVSEDKNELLEEMKGYEGREGKMQEQKEDREEQKGEEENGEEEKKEEEKEEEEEEMTEEERWELFGDVEKEEEEDRIFEEYIEGKEGAEAVKRISEKNSMKNSINISFIVEDERKSEEKGAEREDIEEGKEGMSQKGQPRSPEVEDVKMKRNYSEEKDGGKYEGHYEVGEREEREGNEELEEVQWVDNTVRLEETSPKSNPDPNLDPSNNGSRKNSHIDNPYPKRKHSDQYYHSNHNLLEYNTNLYSNPKPKKSPLKSPLSKERFNEIDQSNLLTHQRLMPSRPTSKKNIDLNDPNPNPSHRFNPNHNPYFNSNLNTKFNPNADPNFTNNRKISESVRTAVNVRADIAALLNSNSYQDKKGKNDSYNNNNVGNGRTRGSLIRGSIPLKSDYQLQVESESGQRGQIREKRGSASSTSEIDPNKGKIEMIETREIIKKETSSPSFLNF